MDTKWLINNIRTNRRVQTAVYDEHFKAVFNSCYRLVNDIHIAEDLMQDAFIQAFKNIEKFRGEAKLGSWICRIAINKCLDHLKKRKVNLIFDNSWECHAERSYKADGNDMDWDVNRIKAAILDLPEGCRIIFNLHIFEEMDHDTIALKLGIKSASSRAQYLRAKNKIRELLKNTYV